MDSGTNQQFWTPARTLAYMFIILLDLLLIWYGVQMRLMQTSSQQNETDIKYVLFWTRLEPIFHSIEDENLNMFIVNSCNITNCVVTTKRKMLQDLRQFDAIVFSAYGTKLNSLPSVRSPEQKYIMASLESPAYFYWKSGSDNPKYFLKDYFNWTWTYRLDSDILWRCFVITDLAGQEVGPKLNMEWLETFDPVPEEIKKKLSSKKKAVAWLVSNCATWSQREVYARKVTRALKKYNLTLDIYGKCAKKKCGSNSECSKMLERDYFFYLAFENAFDEDYVTEKVVRAVESFTVPVVMGGANYSRFLPPGSYLDAQKLTPDKLAETMRNLMANSTLYQEYFRWHSHYKYRESHRAEICNLCKALNDEEKMKKVSIYPDMKEWWTGRQRDVDLAMRQKTSLPIFTELPVKY